MSIYVLSALFFGFGCFILGFIVFFKRKDTIGKRWLLNTIACGLWGIGYAYQINNSESYEIALIVSRLADSAAVFIPVTWLHFVWTYLNLREKKWLFRILYAMCIPIVLTAPTPYFIAGLTDKTGVNIGFVHFVKGGPVFHIFAAYFTIVVLWVFYLIIHKYISLKHDNTAKNRLKYFILATAIGFLSGSTAFLPCYDINLPVQYATLFLPFYPILMAFALSKHRFLDAEEIAQAAQQDKLATIGILAASINHEVRNPLYVICGMAEGYLARENDGLFKTEIEQKEKAREVLQKSIEQSRRAVEIIKRFALFAKEGVKEELNPALVSLNDVIEDVFPLVRHELELDKIELIRQIPADLPALYADRHHLVQIFFNLIVNACQAMKSGGKLTIRGEKYKDKVRVTIQDTGPGIAPEVQAQIFEPFKTTKADGTGLGLYITKLLVEKNSGHVYVTSEVGKGTKFILEFRVSS